MNLWYTAHITVIQTTLVYFLLALSLQLVLKAGVFSLASVGFFAIGGYATGILSLHGWPTIVAIVAPMLVCLGFGYLMAMPLVRLRGVYLALVSVSFALIVSVFATNLSSLTGGATGLYGVPGSTTVPIVAIVVGVAIVAASQFERRRAGRRLELIRLNEDLAASVGVNVPRLRNQVFAVSAALGCLAGSFNVLFTSVMTPDSASFQLIISGLTMAVVGGIDSWLGAVIGAIIVAWLPIVLSFVGAWRQVIYGVIVVLVATYLPAGVLGLIRSALRFLTRAARRSRAPDRPGAPPRVPDGDLSEVRQ